MTVMEDVVVRAIGRSKEEISGTWFTEKLLFMEIVPQHGIEYNQLNQYMCS